MKYRRVVSGLVASVLAAGALVVAVAAPAYAAESCRGNTKAFQNGANTVWRNITMQTCIEPLGIGLYRAHIKMILGAKGGNPSLNLFYHMFINVRLERYDVDIQTNQCDVTSSANGQPYGWMMNCYTPAASGQPSGGWTSDGYISYDIIGDGLGDLTWSLTGSPMVT